MSEHTAPSDPNEFKLTPFVLTSYCIGGGMGLLVFFLLYYAQPILEFGNRVWPFFDIL